MKISQQFEITLQNKMHIVLLFNYLNNVFKNNKIITK